MIEYLTNNEEEIDIVYKLFNKYSKEVWFVMKPTIRERLNKKELTIYRKDDKIIWACSFHKKRDWFTVIYEIVVDKDYRGNGYGKDMIEFLIYKRHNIILKCPIDNESNKFYDKIWWKLYWVEKWKKRQLNLWHLNFTNYKK